mgnify:CR=1 FL=1
MEDLFLYEEYRHGGLGKKFFSQIEEFVKQDGYNLIEWSCLGWNMPSIRFYNQIGAVQEHGRKYFSYICKYIVLLFILFEKRRDINGTVE